MTQRVLLGKFPEGGYGLRVSEAGYDVTSNPIDNTRLVFNSDWASTLPIYLSGSANVPNNSFTRVDFPNLGYTPFAMALINHNTMITSKRYTFSNGEYFYGNRYQFPYGTMSVFSDHIDLINYNGANAIMSYAIYRVQAFA
jgi:hypothetical protein